jgi:AcrR family transcriptional regulator
MERVDVNPQRPQEPPGGASHAAEVPAGPRGASARPAEARPSEPRAGDARASEARGDGRTERAEKLRAERRAHILRTALRVFAEKGYHRTSVSDVVEAAGVARGTFYLYFESKSLIFLALVDELLDHLRRNVSGVDLRPGAAPVDRQIVAIVEHVLRTTEQNRALATILFREAVGLDADVDDKLRRFYASLEGYIAEALREGQRMGAVRADLDVAVVSTCVLGSVKQVIDQHLVGATADGAFDVPRFARAILDYNLRGVLAP